MLPSPRENISLAQRRIHSPSLPELWVPTGNRFPADSGAGVNSVQFPPAARPSLGSLDLASPPTKSALPLTPPLTPASARHADSELSEARSSRSNSFDITHFDPYAYNFSPISQWSISDPRSMSHPIQESDHYLSSRSVHISNVSSVLPSPTSPTYPKHSSQRVRELDSSDLEAQPASRFLFITGIPKTANSQALKQAFAGCGDLKGIFVRFQAEHGAIILAFFDLRHAIRAHRQIHSRMFFDGIALEARFISASELRNLIGQSNFVSQNDGDLFIATSFVGPEGELDAAALQNVLASFGDLRSFRMTDAHARAFHVEYFDARDATSASNALNGRVILGVRLHLTFREADPHPGPPLREGQITVPRETFSEAPASPTATGIPFPLKSSPAPDLERRLSVDGSQQGTRQPGLHHSISEQDLRARAKTHSQSSTPQPPPLPPPQFLSRVKTPPQHVHSRRISNIYHFDSVGKMELPRTPPRPRSISVSSDTASPVAGRLALPPSPTTGSGRPVPPSSGVARILPPYQGPLPIPGPVSVTDETQWPLERDPISAVSEPAYMPEQYFVGHQNQQQAESVIELGLPGPPRRHIAGHRQAQSHSLGHAGMGIDPDRERESQPERNKIDIGKIERGEETRTTVMIKNIPNKMSDRHLIEFINDVCPRKIDFLYLRMDFTNGCNVGYAFVNFIHVQDLLHFAKTKLGTKWNLFSSEKVLGMSYANYQGKEALIDKFRSSSIMDQREAWRPKLFYSHGAKKGLPEEFPAPTHMRRKERSNLLPNELHQSRSLFHHPSGTRG